MNPGDRICILVDGSPAETEIDPHGVQRFVQNDAVDWLIRSGQIDLNQLWMDFYTNSDCAITRESMIEFYMSIGYSVCGFDEVFGPSSSFHDNGNEPVEILNPVWEREVVTEH
jgi:hypothetical protein